jgi:hypothetical protein
MPERAGQRSASRENGEPMFTPHQRRDASRAVSRALVASQSRAVSQALTASHSRAAGWALNAYNFCAGTAAGRA